MKRLFLVCLTIMITAFVANMAFAAGQEFSKPILIGGDEPDAAKDQKTTQATSLKAIVHPLSQPADKNFKIDEGNTQPIQPDDMAPIFVDDVAATPGWIKKDPMAPVSPGSPMIEHPKSRFNGFNVQAVGPEDINLSMTANNITNHFTYQFEYEIFRNYESQRMVLGDIRVVDMVNDPNEFTNLFGAPPLEEVVISGVSTPLIGNADEVKPYTAEKYPAAIIADPDKYPFSWCPYNWSPFKTLAEHPCWNQKLFSNNKYDKVFLYDVANLRNGLVSASYDPLNLFFSKIYIKLFINNNPLGPVPKDNYFFSYYSPLTLFRLVQDPNNVNDIRYKFSGYSSIEVPEITCTKHPNFTICDANWWKILPTNWIIPVATNPISIKAIDLKGVASPPDRDLAVTYQTTLFNLEKPVPDAFGRPAVFGDGMQHAYRELLGTCDGPCSTATFKPLTKDRFPDDVVSFVLFYKQTNQWAEGADNAPYINANASHIFDVPLKPSEGPGWALVGPGAYDSAVLTDFANEPAKRKQYLLVPSRAEDPSDPIKNGVIYIVDKDPANFSKNQIHFMRPRSKDEGFWIFNQNFNPTKPVCKTEDVTFAPTPIILPGFIPVAKPDAGFVPYQIRTGNLDGDQCDDFIITWRGIRTISDPAHPGNVVFDNGSGVMFSNFVTIVLRYETAGGCGIKLPQQFPGGQYDDPRNTPIQIKVVDQTNPTPAVAASATIGDFDSDGINDIAAGNLASEGKTAYAYFYKGGGSIPFDPVGVERVRVGFYEAALPFEGTGMIETDRTKWGPNVLMQINGYPLMLPDIQCPDYALNTTNPSVGSVYESYVSLANNVFTKLINIFGPGVNATLGSAPGVPAHIDPFDINLPFLDPVAHKPLPPRCVDNKPPCEKGGDTRLPFFADDPCCVDACGMAKKAWVEKCAIYVYAYGLLGQACPLLKYVYQWGDPTLETDAECGPQFWSKNQSPSMELLNRALAKEDGQGSGDSGGETDFAQTWRPDNVVSGVSNAIADRKDLTLAQATVEKITEEAKVAPTISTTETAEVEAPMPFLSATLPIRALFGLSLGDSAGAQQFKAELETNPAYAEMEKDISKSIVGSVIGAPNSLEMVFMQPTAALVVAGASETQGMLSNLGVGTKEGAAQTLSEKSSSGGCSLVAPDVIASQPSFLAGEAISWNNMREKLSSFVSRVWDLLVPSADAAFCGDQNIEAPETCEFPNICSQAICFGAAAQLCYGPDATATIPCTCGPPVCNDGCLTAGEACDKTAYNPPANFGCPPNKICTDQCTCISHLQINTCGNGVQNGTEECDPGLPGVACQEAGQYCTGNCKCAPNIQFGVKLPIGMNMPGHREMTAVVRKGKVPPNCNYNGVKDAWEECDVAGLSDAAALAQIQAVCPPAVAPAVLDDCDMNDCTCDYMQPGCKLGDPNVQCEQYSDCAADEICDINCKCVPPPGIPPGEGPGPGDVLSSTYNDCYVHADTFSGNAEAEIYKKLNDGIRQITGRMDDLYVEPEQRATVYCKIGGGAAPNIPAADLSLSLSGTPLPDSADNLRPWMVVQNSGSEFIDSGTLKYKEFTLVEAPMRLLPMEGGPSAQIVLPSSSLQGVSPMATTSVAAGTGGVTQVNNMIEHRVFSVLPGQEYTIIMGGAAQKIKAQSAEIPEGAGVVIHEIKYIIPPDCASWTGVAGYKGCPVIEKRQFDGAAVEKAIKENMAGMSAPITSAVYMNLPWEENDKYQFTLAQDVYVKAGDPELPSVELNYALNAGKPMEMGRGGGCSCNMGAGAFGMNAVLSYLLIIAVPAAGVAIARVRRRKK